MRVKEKIENFRLERLRFTKAQEEAASLSAVVETLMQEIDFSTPGLYGLLREEVDTWTSRDLRHQLGDVQQTIKNNPDYALAALGKLKRRIDEALQTSKANLEYAESSEISYQEANNLRTQLRSLLNEKALETTNQTDNLYDLYAKGVSLHERQEYQSAVLCLKQYCEEVAPLVDQGENALHRNKILDRIWYLKYANCPFCRYSFPEELSQFSSHSCHEQYTLMDMGGSDHKSFVVSRTVRKDTGEILFELVAATKSQYQPSYSLYPRTCEDADFSDIADTDKAVADKTYTYVLEQIEYTEFEKEDEFDEYY